MPTEVHACECEACQTSKDHSNWQVHHQMNVFLSRLDEQQRGQHDTPFSLPIQRV